MVSEKYAKEHFAIKHNINIKTKFIDKLDAVKVVMLDYPDTERAKKVLVNFSEASWFEDFYSQASEEDKTTAIHDLLSGNMLGQGLEALQFTFLVSGLDLHDSHAVVRNRIGVSYLQQSSAVRPLTNSDILVPRAFTKHTNLLERYKQWCLDGKRIYQDMLETGDISITDARLVLPKTTPVWINISCNLMTLLAIYSKRSDTQEEYVALNIMVEKMKELVIEKFPYMKGYFVSACDKKTCLHCKPGYKCNCIFKRDDKHQTFIDNWTLHDKTKKELMLDCNKYITENYIGHTKINDESSNTIKK
jgi:thymidylate synthase (FAD)